MQYKQLESV